MARSSNWSSHWFVPSRPPNGKCGLFHLHSAEYIQPKWEESTNRPNSVIRRLIYTNKAKWMHFSGDDMTPSALGSPYRCNHCAIHICWAIWLQIQFKYLAPFLPPPPPSSSSIPNRSIPTARTQMYIICAHFAICNLTVAHLDVILDKKKYCNHHHVVVRRRKNNNNEKQSTETVWISHTTINIILRYFLSNIFICRLQHLSVILSHTCWDRSRWWIGHSIRRTPPTRPIAPAALSIVFSCSWPALSLCHRLILQSITFPDTRAAAWCKFDRNAWPHIVFCNLTWVLLIFTIIIFIFKFNGTNRRNIEAKMKMKKKTQKCKAIKGGRSTESN